MSRFSFEEIVILVIGVVLITLLVSVLLAVPVMLLWNWLMPYIFDLPVLDLWQAFGLSLLCSLPFKSFRVTAVLKSKQ